MRNHHRRHWGGCGHSDGDTGHARDRARRAAYRAYREYREYRRLAMHRHRRRRGGAGHRGFGMRGRFFGAGEVRLALLSLIGEGEKHGYQLMRELEERSDGAYRASAGTIYPTLAQLEDEGLAVSESRDGKRVFRLTEAGRTELSRESEAISRIWRRADEWGQWGDGSDWSPAAAEVLRPALRLARAAFRAASRAEDDPATIEEIRAILDRAREELGELRRSS